LATLFGAPTDHAPAGPGAALFQLAGVYRAGAAAG